MSVISIKNALALGAGAIVPGVSGVIKNVYPVYNGVGRSDSKPYTVQNILLEDNEGNVRVSVWNHPDLTSLKGAAVTISSVKSGNGRLSGLQVVSGQDKDGVATIGFKVGDLGLILPAGSVPVQQGPVEAPTPLPGSINEKTQSTPANTAPQATFQPPAKPTLDDLVALYGQCFRAARVILPRESDDATPDGDTLQAIVASTATLYISAVNAQLAVGAAKRDPVQRPQVEVPKTETQPF